MFENKNTWLYIGVIFIFFMIISAVIFFNTNNSDTMSSDDWFKTETNKLLPADNFVSYPVMKHKKEMKKEKFEERCKL